MRLKTLAAAATAVITAALGQSVITASPAAAAEVEVGTWRSYASNPINAGNSTWRCGTPKSIGADISGRPCIISTADGQSVQGAVVILNNRSTVVPVEAAVVVYDAAPLVTGKLGEWHCGRSGVGGSSWSVCFGDTFYYPDRVFTHGGANGHDLGISPYL
jgi:hypothetical protein